MQARPRWATRGARAALLLLLLIILLASVLWAIAPAPRSTPRATTARASAPDPIRLAAAAGAGTPAATQPFLDDFDGVAGAPPDPARWVDYGPHCGAYASWGEIRCGASEHLDGRGHLVIPASPSGGSALQTKGRYAFTYGTLSAWIQMPPRSGYWPAFWTLNGDQTGSEALTGEIDVTEVYTPSRRTHSNVHVWRGPRKLWATPDGPRAAGADLSQGFHEYSVDIEPGQITFLLDGVRVRSVKKSSAPRWAWGPDVTRPNFLILDLAVRRAARPAPSAPASMLVDRVQVIPVAAG
jgi:hypothetical protein